MLWLLGLPPVREIVGTEVVPDSAAQAQLRLNPYHHSLFNRLPVPFQRRSTAPTRADSVSARELRRKGHIHESSAL